MTRLPLRTRWRRRLWSTRLVSATVKVTLLLMCDYMRENGHVSVPQATLARTLGCNDRRVRDHIKQAIDAELLCRVGGGYRGRTAEYQALLPVEKGGRKLAAINDPEIVRFSCGERRPPVRPPIPTTDLSSDGSAQDESSDGDDEMDGLRLADLTHPSISSNHNGQPPATSTPDDDAAAASPTTANVRRAHSVVETTPPLHNPHMEVTADG